VLIAQIYKEKGLYESLRIALDGYATWDTLRKLRVRMVYKACERYLTTMVPPIVPPPAQFIHPVGQDLDPGITLIGKITPCLKAIARGGQIDRHFLGSEIRAGFKLIEFCMHPVPASVKMNLSRAKARRPTGSITYKA
jgi:hypothetical protein